MTYLLIIFVIALALAPLSHFVPSKRQREVARMREYAAVHGLFVEFRGLPGAAVGRLRERDPDGGETIYYGKRLPPAKRKGEKQRAWLREGDAWVGLERRSEVPPQLLELPPEVLAASVEEGSCGVYWRESGGVEAVARITQVLGTWSAILRPR